MSGPTSSISTPIPTRRAVEIVDTTVLLRAIDPRAGARRRQARDLIARLVARDALAVSVQVLSEFHAATTRPRHAPPSVRVRAIQVVAALIEAAAVLPLTAPATLRALDAMAWHGLAFGDALLWATARDSGVAVVHSENFPDGRNIEGVLFANPFA